ncbi:MAG TPA: adenylate/guanylate cyclase domain-containing protein [Chloroflexota bacterium]|nr:adenylate/guanylate cyclase domain-containing protein [Chloroflexota bacterium]
MPLQVNGAVLTDLGRMRTVNEDWCGSLVADESSGNPDEPSVWVIADGVSRFGTGRDAARLAVEAMLGAGWDTRDVDPGRLLMTSVDTANRILWARAHGSSGSSRPHAATVVAVVIRGETAWIVSAGDCRAYMIRSGTIRQITRDHTVAAEEVRQGRLRPEDVHRHPGRNTITRCLGQRATVQPDLFQEALQPGDRLLLCSDGITRHVADEEILRIATSAEPKTACEQLVELANQRGGSDNITVGILEMIAVRPEPRAMTPVASLTDLSTSRLAALQAMGQRITASLEVPATMRSVLDSLVEITGAERACIMLRDPDSGLLEFATGRNLDASGVANDPSISRNIVGTVFRDGRPLILGDAAGDPRFKAFESVVGQSLRSVICAPLIVRGQTIGVVYVDNSLSAELFTQADLDLVTAFANIAAAAIENARLHERLAAQVREISAMKTTQDRILRSVSSGIISVDREGTIMSCNQAAAEMLLKSADEVIGCPLGDILPPRFMLALGAPFGGEGVEPGATIQGFEMAGTLTGRGYVYFAHRLSPLRDEAGSTIGYVLVLDDHTEREQLDRERRRATAERERIQKIFEPFMPPQVFQELLRQGPEKTGITGDRRELTVMFADIRGFTGISERLQPEQVVELLNGYLSTATDVVFEHQGTVDKFIGDAIMALFGAPVQIENHALQTVRAAMAMQRRFAETPASQGQRASFGIGINTGQGVVGTIGAPQLMSYTVIGDVVNVAARLQGEARAGEVLITEDTFRLVANHVDTEELGSIYVKGRLAPVTMYKVTAVRA